MITSVLKYKLNLGDNKACRAFFMFSTKAQISLTGLVYFKPVIMDFVFPASHVAPKTSLI